MRRATAVAAAAAIVAALALGSVPSAGAADGATDPSFGGNSPAATAPATVDSLIVQYEPGVAPVKANGDVTGAEAVPGVELDPGEALGTGLRTVELAQPLTEAQAQRVADELEQSAAVRVVEPDLPVSVLGTQAAPPWGLDRIDQRDLPFDGSYSYASSGRGVTAYVIDTGIRATHSEFGGRVTGGYNAVTTDRTAWADCHGHGTHVAGTLGGSTYGVAKEVSFVAVRVLDCTGWGTSSSVIEGLNWVADNHVAGQPAVANMSIGGGISTLIDAAVRRVVDDGVTVVVASGNSRTDACQGSPAREPSAITVNALDGLDVRASFSNYGSCTDIYAPGVSVLSSTSDSDTSTATWSGTSMATPHAAGVAARLLSEHPDLSPAQVAALMISTATRRSVSTIAGDPQLVLYADSGAPAAPDGVPGAPTAVALQPAHLALDVTWAPPASSGSSPLLGYHAAAFTMPTGGTEAGGCTSNAYSSPGCRIAGLTAGTTYYVEVSASNSVGSGPVSAPRVAQAAVRWRPSAPQQVSAQVIGARVTVSWQPPADSGNSALTGYSVLGAPGATGSTTRAYCTAVAPATSCGFTIDPTMPQPLYLEVVASNSQYGSGDSSSPRVAVIADFTPGPPVAVTAVSSADTATIAWERPVDGLAGHSYSATVYSAASGGVVITRCATTALTCKVSGLQRGATYWAEAAATIGNYTGAPSPRVPLLMSPASPRLDSLTAGDGSISVAWTPGGDGGSPIVSTTVTAYLGTARAGSCTSAATSCRIDSLANNSTYTVSAVSANAVGTSLPSSKLSATPRAVPGVPAVAIRSVTRDSLTVDVTPLAPSAASVNAVTARAYDSSTGSMASTCTKATVSGRVASCVLAGLSPGTAYFVSAVAATSYTTSATSARVSATTRPATVPGALRTVAARLQADGTLRVTWTLPADDGGRPLTSVTSTVYSQPSGGARLAQCTGSVAITAGACTLAGIPVGTTAYVDAYASNAVGAGASLPARIAVRVIAAPAKPAIASVQRGPASATVAFTRGAEGGLATTYTVTAWSAPTGGSILATCQPGNASSCSLPLKAGTNAWFEVKAANALGFASASRAQR